MTLFGVDIHPHYQAGISIEQIAREGFSWLTVKASQGTNTSWARDANAWLDRGDRAGMLTFPYHYLSTDDVDAQVRAVRSYAGARPVMLDAEEGSGNVANVRRFLDAAGRAGLRVPLVYLPRWWWEKVGKGSLAGLALVSSRYRTATGYASTIYEGVPADWWAGYGDGHVAVLQFSDRASVAGQKIDVNAFRGTRDELAALLRGRPAGPTTASAQEGAMPSVNDVWGQPISDNYTPDPTDSMRADVALGWATAHAARAADAAALAAKAVADLTAALKAKGVI